MKTRGFTLIEVSIVIVVIGLLVSGVLVGRDLIRVAELRATISQIEKLNTAVSTFRLKYNCLPGDCDHATAVGLDTGCFPNCDGNGDGIIDFVNAPSCNQDEMIRFFYHLNNSNLIANPGSGVFPKTKFSNGYISMAIQFIYGGAGACGPNLDGHADLILQASTTDPVTFRNAPLFSPVDAFYMDTKMDDGAPYSGVFTGSGEDQGGLSGVVLPYSTSEGAAGGNFCVNTDTTPATYNTQVSSILCVGHYQIF